MATQNAAKPRTGGSLKDSAKAGVKRASMIGVLVAAFQEMGAKNVLASTALTVGAPLAATAFVYEVAVMRDAQLVREAVDRRDWTVRAASLDEAPPVPMPAVERPAAAAPVDVTAKLDAMLAARIRILDTFGDEPSAVAPVYARIIKDMLADDDKMFASIETKEKLGLEEAGDGLALKGAMLRKVHARLEHLVGA